ncbi:MULTISPECIES: arsenate reductase (thioredoxin) [Sporosarcina]|uniref:arsenate reductase (thioredoxin) n=1 Tax=Sporosarcina TaxID=1569 RepID=UPI00058C1437|nr:MULTISPECIES: arsenate reductase (thioredoxin) [Sporosarcina]WJY28091.1 arsenate reductase (thioredoxin) [Sporosarcina sp. 0.2-SM1T-5]
MERKLIYFICTGNACRSQMAEGYARNILGNGWEVRSGGIEAHGVNADAVSVMKEDGIDISRQTSDVIDPSLLARSTLVVTLCDHADANCPVMPPGVPKEHWPFPDPAGGSWERFQQVRDDIRKRIEQFLAQGRY